MRASAFRAGLADFGGLRGPTVSESLANSLATVLLAVLLAVVLTAGPVDRVVDTAASRLGYTAAGGAILAVGLVVARRVLPRLPDPASVDVPTA